MTELPLIVVNSQRGGPSTGLPTKTEQSDLYQAVYGRNGDSPVPVIAARSPADAFDCAIEAVRIATRYMVPVMLLTDGYIANAAEPWKVPDMSGYAPFPVEFFETQPAEGEGVLPYMRNADLARPWIRPGTPGLEHRIGGLEKSDILGNVSYDPENHHRMQTLRAAKVAGIAKDIPPLDVFGPPNGDLLILGWGSTYGAIRSAVERLQAEGHSVAHAHLRHLNPFPANTEEVVRSYRRVLIPEVNLGQLLMLIRARYLVDAIGYDKVRGKPFRIVEIVDEAERLLKELE